jgi:hypothetical protein
MPNGKDRIPQQKFNSKTRYALVVTISSDDYEIDIYVEIENIIETQTGIIL